MRKLLVTCLIALLAGIVSAQTTPRTSTQSGATKSRVPQTTTSPTQTNNAKSAKTSAAPQTDANSTARSSQPSSQSRSTQTSSTPTTARSQTARPSAATTQNTTGNSNTTARSIATPTAKKAPDVKAVNPVRVKWMTLEEALEKSKTDKRKIFVDVYTDWCSWCKRMDSTTFISPAVAQYLNDHYYPVKFNAEQQKEIVFKDKTYQFKKNGAKGYHELAAEWLNNRLSYPTVVFLDENQGTIQPLQGYQDAAKMEAVLNYFGTDSHKKTPWESYQKSFNSSSGQK